MEGSLGQVFLSRTSELHKFPSGRSFVTAAESAVKRAGGVITDMAYFAARDDKPSEYCRNMVRACDIYVGLIGLRYGSPVRDLPEASYTELEFDTATEAGKTRLIFLLDENEALPIPPTWLRDDDPDLVARQQAFRKRLRGAGVITRTFASPQQLETELLHALQEARGPDAPETETGTWELRGHRPDHFFTGRDNELAALHQAFRAGGATSAVQAVTGLGGLGKTRLAVEYAFRYATAYDLVWWIRAEDPATMRGDYVELAKALALPSGKDDQAIAALRRELQRRRDWLLVFDNAEDPGELFSLVPERHRGHVLITSRRREWPHAETRHLEVLSAEAAVGYLQRRGQVADADLARDLADALGCLPLALAQAASVIATGMRAADYLDLLRKQSPELFEEGHPADHEATIGSTWRVSVDRLAQRSPAAVALFRLAAFLGADAIPLDRLSPVPLMPAELAETLASPFLLSRATAALGEYSLAETADGLLSIHRIVQAVTRSELGEDEPRWAGLALATIAAAYPGQVREPETWEVCESLLTHALACAEHARRLRLDVTVTVPLIDRVARYLLARGRLDSAAAAMDQAIPLAEQLGREDLIYLSCRNTYGQLLLARGDFTAARSACEEVYQARTRILGADDPETLRASRDLVEAVHRQGNWTEAAELQVRLTESFTRVLGPDDLETVTALAHQAAVLESIGHYAQALALQEQVLEARTRMLGQDHLDTLTAKASLAGALRNRGELRQARAMEEEVLEAFGRMLGQDHPYTLAAKSNLAGILRDLGELHQARAMEEEILEASSRVLGQDHPDTLTTKANLATTLYHLGELRQARAMEEQILEASSRVLGQDHPHTLNAQNRLAAALAGLGEFHQARAMQEQVLETRSRMLGQDHPATLSDTGNLAGTLRRLGELDEARAMQEQVLEAFGRVLGQDHPDTLTTKANLAETLLALNELDEARTLQEQILEARRRVLGEEHAATLGAMISLALTIHAQGNKKDAIALLHTVLEISLRVLGQRHTVTTNAAWQVAQTFQAHGGIGQRAFILRNLSWLGDAPAGQLTAEQKKIKNELKGVVHTKNTAKKKNAAGRKKRK